MKKEEFIKETWKELLPFEPKGGYNLNDGYSNQLYEQCQESINYDFFDYEQVTFNSGKIRPKSLRDVENNNGWIKIESEEDLPTPELGKEYYFISLEKNTEKSEIITGYTDKKGKYFICSESYRVIHYNDTFYKITHYQPIEKPKPPIY